MIEASQILEGLFQGSAPPQGLELRRAGFDAVVLCAEEVQPPDAAFPGVEVLRAPLDDGSLPTAELAIAVAAAEDVAKRVRAGRKVLVTCAQGRNRSGLVTALAIMRLRGMTGDQAVRIVRMRRKSPFGPALSNEAFARKLREISFAAAPAPPQQRAGQDLSSLLDPYGLGQQLGSAAASGGGGALPIPTPSGLSSAEQAAQQAYQDQAARAADLLRQQQMQASGSAKQAGAQVSSAAGGLGTMVLVAAGVIAVALLLRRG